MCNWDIVACSFQDFLKAGFHGFYKEEFIVYVIILRLLRFWIEEFIDCRFQVSVWNFDFVGGHI